MIKYQPIKPIIFGCEGLTFSQDEKDFFGRENPLGLILFDRNIKNPQQVRQLVDDFRSIVDRTDAPVLIDQEGGRVQRLWPPYWKALGWSSVYGDWYSESPEKAEDGVRQHTGVLADNLKSCGINVDCWPCLDVSRSDTHDVMKLRCFSFDPEIVAKLGQIAVETAIQSGFMPVIKHIPGYGRTKVDPHRDLPIVTEPLEILEETDFYPFRQIKKHVWGMTAHVLYTALDDVFPATLSSKVISYIRREIGFDGFLICDDICMKALAQFGSLSECSLKMLEAGCDAVLHCSGNLSEMKEIASALSPLCDLSLRRLLQSMEILKNG